jgi:hypothetical protein
MATRSDAAELLRPARPGGRDIDRSLSAPGRFVLGHCKPPVFFSDAPMDLTTPSALLLHEESSATARRKECFGGNRSAELTLR